MCLGKNIFCANLKKKEYLQLGSKTFSAPAKSYPLWTFYYSFLTRLFGPYEKVQFISPLHEHSAQITIRAE